MIYLAHYLYIGPDDTYYEGQSRPVVSLCYMSSSLEDVIEYIADNFDGLETFREKFEPMIIDTLKERDVYFGDDWSAGQWFRVTKLDNDQELTIESVL